MSKSQVTVGSISYPDVTCPLRDSETAGTIVFAQAVLAPDMPYQILDFPQGDTGFPHDSTGDQFFDAGQFDAYQVLGYFIGQKAARSAPLADSLPQSGPPGSVPVT